MKSWLRRKWIDAVNRWDFFVYKLAHKSLNRMCQRREGWAYLFELSLRDWREEHPPTEQMMKATERFHEAMRSSNR